MNATCRGAWVLGSACGHCSRCVETALDGARAMTQLVRELSAKQTARVERDEMLVFQCAMVAERVQMRIEAAIERDGSREAAIKWPGMGFGLSLMGQIVHTLRKAADAIDPKRAAEYFDALPQAAEATEK